jgi:hypothetical protein
VLQRVQRSKFTHLRKRQLSSLSTYKHHFLFLLSFLVLSLLLLFLLPLRSSDFYCKHRKAYKGPEGLTAEQFEKIETGDTFSGRIEGTTEDLVKGTGAVVLGVKNGFRKIGDKVSGGANAATKPVKDTEWYKKKQEKNEKKKKEKEAKGVKTEGGVFSGIGDIAKTGWGALSKYSLILFLFHYYLVESLSSLPSYVSSLSDTVKDGVEKGMVAAGTGVRDASVQATRHTDGDYAAELSKQRWNAVGNVAQSFDNAYSLLKATSTWWVKAAIYTSTGVIAYDADLPNKMSGRKYLLLFSLSSF